VNFYQSHNYQHITLHRINQSISASKKYFSWLSTIWLAHLQPHSTYNLTAPATSHQVKPHSVYNVTVPTTSHHLPPYSTNNLTTPTTLQHIQFHSTYHLRVPTTSQIWLSNAASFVLLYKSSAHHVDFISNSSINSKEHQWNPSLTNAIFRNNNSNINTWLTS